MALNIQLPSKKQLREIERNKYQVPVDQIIKTLGNNPLAQGINTGVEDFTNALQKRYELQQRVLGKKAIESAYGLQPDTLKDVPYDVAPAVGANIFKDKTVTPKQEVLFMLGKDGSVIDAVTKKPLQILPNVNYTQVHDYANESNLRGSGQLSKDEANWIKLGDHVNSLRQSSRSALGAAAIANQRADRALEVLDNPGASPQQLDYAMTDLAAIFQNGSPHETALNRQQYNTLKTKFINLKTYLTANPSAAGQPEVQKQIKQTVSEIKQVDNKIVKDNLGIAGVQFENLIKKDPERWNRLIDAVTKTTIGTAEDQTLLPPPGETKDQRKARLLAELAGSK